MCSTKTYMGNANRTVTKENSSHNFADRGHLVKLLQKMASNRELHAVKSKDTVSQWVEKVTRYSSQYDADSWPASCVLGPPRVYPKYGDIPGAWASGTIDANQFLEVEFKDSVYVTGIDIYETYHAGGVKAIKAFDAEGKWRTLWSTDRVSVIKSSRVFSPPLAELGCRTRKIRVEVDCTGCGTWVEIDAIQLHGRTFLTDPPPSMETLASDLGQIVNDSKFSDCKFLLEGKSVVYAHKAIICARSDYFKAMFVENTRESMSTTAIEIRDVQYNSFLAVMYFLYTNNLPTDSKIPCDTVTLTDVWRVADRFSMEGLRKLAAHMITNKIDKSNVVDTYLAASNSLPIIEEVKNNCVLFMATNLQTIVKTPSFEALSQEVMLEIIQSATSRIKLS